jgi:hypothetical protein
MLQQQTSQDCPNIFSLAMQKLFGDKPELLTDEAHDSPEENFQQIKTYVQIFHDELVNRALVLDRERVQE